MKRLFVLAFMLFAAVVSFSQRPITTGTDVRLVKNKFMINGNQLFYNLPQNVFRVELKVKQTIQYQGPYAFYAKRFLNISEGIVGENSSYYELVDVSANRYSVPDSSQYYTITTESGNLPLLQINADGVLLGANVNYEIEGYSTNFASITNITEELEDEYFFDMGVKAFEYEKSETAYRMVATDSTPVRVPYTKKNLVPVSESDNAAYAADQIRKIRKRRAKLLFDQVGETNPKSHETANVLIDELNKYEQRYLELFVGKSIERELSYAFDVVPNSGSEPEQRILCWFSPQSGIRISTTSVRRGDFKPVFSKLVSIGQVPNTDISLIDNTQKSPVVIHYGLYYRLPGKVKLMLEYQNQTLYSQQFEVAQKGVVVPLPVDYLQNSQYGIELHPETGALKRLLKNN